MTKTPLLLLVAWMRGALLCLVAAASLKAQPLAFRRFELNDGLPQSQVTVLMEDRHGFLWVGTNTNGLARLAAGTFHPYGIAQGVRARSISALLEDRRGAIWAASYDSGVSEIYGSRVTNHGPQDGLAASQAFGLALDKEGRILVATRLGLFRQSSQGFEHVSLPDVWGAGPILRIAADPSGRIWMSTRNRRVASWDGQRVVERPFPADTPPGDLTDLHVDQDGQPFALLQQALMRLEGGQWVKVPLPGLPSQLKMANLTFGPSGERIICLGGDGLLIQAPDGRVTHLTHADGLPRDLIQSALRGWDGTLWVGSDGDGLAAQVVPQLRNIGGAGTPDQPDLGAIMRVLELGRGDFLLAASTGLYRFVEGKGITGHWGKGDGFPSEELWALLPDGKGGVWVGTDRGLSRWKDGRIMGHGPKEMGLAAVVALTRHAGHLWAGTDAGLYELDEEGGYVNHYQSPPGLGMNQVYDLLSDGKDLLMGLRLGVYALEGGRFEKRFPEAPFATQSITCMTRDSQGALWVGTVEGLHVQRGDHWETIGVRQGLLDDNISFLIEAAPGVMAVGHGKGVAILEGGAIHPLTHNEGLISDETNHDGATVDSQGRLWMGMIGGVSILSEAIRYRSPGAPKPVVVETTWPQGSALYPRSLQLPPRPDAVQLSFDLARPAVPTAPRYEAVLEGVDRAWRTVEQGNALQYLNLGKGAYRFRIRASLDGLHWVEGDPLELEIRPAWYERWSVRILLIFAGLVLVVGGVRWRVARLEGEARVLEDKVAERTAALDRQNLALQQAHDQIKRTLEQRLQLMDMVTHDLRSPLTTLTLSVDRLREGVEDEEERATLLSVLELETQRIEGMVRQFLDESKAGALNQNLRMKAFTPKELLEGIEEVLKLKAKDRNLAMNLEVAPGTGHHKVEADAAAIQQVVLNLFENALKFTPPGGSVGVRSSIEAGERFWRLEVWDTGRGLEPEDVDRIFKPFMQARSEDSGNGWGLGLSICMNLLELHHGELRVRSEPGHGATFIITLPLIGAGSGANRSPSI
ncbi:MAG TPA: ATP-binding protein [Holophagaceae bacterium]|nr:ATP-binding protein [Holophagaceae bacterium]